MRLGTGLQGKETGNLEIEPHERKLQVYRVFRFNPMKGAQMPTISILETTPCHTAKYWPTCAGTKNHWLTEVDRKHGSHWIG
jgi:hypothetical protein